MLSHTPSRPRLWNAVQRSYPTLRRGAVSPPFIWILAVAGCMKGSLHKRRPLNSGSRTRGVLGRTALRRRLTVQPPTRVIKEICSGGDIGQTEPGKKLPVHRRGLLEMKAEGRSEVRQEICRNHPQSSAAETPAIWLLEWTTRTALSFDPDMDYGFASRRTSNAVALRISKDFLLDARLRWLHA